MERDDPADMSRARRMAEGALVLGPALPRLMRRTPGSNGETQRPQLAALCSPIGPDTATRQSHRAPPTNAIPVQSLIMSPRLRSPLTGQLAPPSIELSTRHGSDC